MTELDIQKRLQLHSQASVKRDAWARIAIDLLAQGKDKQGMAAASKAKYWEAKARALEP